MIISLLCDRETYPRFDFLAIFTYTYAKTIIKVVFLFDPKILAMHRLPRRRFTRRWVDVRVVSFNRTKPWTNRETKDVRTNNSERKTRRKVSTCANADKNFVSVADKCYRVTHRATCLNRLLFSRGCLCAFVYARSAKTLPLETGESRLF